MFRETLIVRLIGPITDQVLSKLNVDLDRSLNHGRDCV